VVGAIIYVSSTKYAGAAVGGFVGGATGGSVVPGAGTVIGGIAGATMAVSGTYAVQAGTEAAIDTTVTSTSNAIAANITSDSVLQKEFASTIKICELGLLCVGSAKAAKALKGTLKTQAAKLPSVPKVHLNSNQYVGECKLYEIFRVSDKEIVKAGETARGYNASGKLIRPWEQCRSFEKQFGERFYYRELGTYSSKAEVRAAETKLILERRALNPNALPFNKGVH
jgi:septal ring-binding cell division protein DamX